MAGIEFGPGVGNPDHGLVDVGFTVSAPVQQWRSDQFFGHIDDKIGKVLFFFGHDSDLLFESYLGSSWPQLY
jgi:hypothetical protein